MAKVYLETTIPSYLASYPSHDLVVASHQQITHDWWRDAKTRFDLFVSEAVLEEIRAGDPEAASRRLQIVAGLPVLELSENVRELVRVYDQHLGLPSRARADLPHFAFAVSYKMDYLLTWNCSHIANGEVIRRLMNVNFSLNLFMPLIITPEEILENL